VAAPVSTSPELSARPRRRTFTAKDKLRILADIDRATGKIFPCRLAAFLAIASLQNSQAPNEREC
jgi:hypothetical protein